MGITLFNAPTTPIHSPVYILHGQCGSSSGSIQVSTATFPSQQFDLTNGFFKAILNCTPGLNHFHVQRIGDNNTTESSTTTQQCVVEYIPLLQNPPLHLCLLVASDSPLNFDAPRSRSEGGNKNNMLDVAVKKLQLAGRLMQAFTQQEMFRNGFGNRVFRFVEEFQPSSLSHYDEIHGAKRSEIKVHVLRSQKTLAQLRDPNLAQQNSKGSNTGGLFNIAIDELRRQIPACSSQATKLQPAYAAVMFLDTHWDTKLRLILTHAALGGGTDDLKLAIFGSHGLWSWPKHIEELSRAFTDEYRSDINEVANDCNECSTAWECVNITMGAFMHEIGHLYGCPHQESGIMLRDYVTWNRTFMTREAHSVRTGRPAWGPVASRDECHWHRLDLVRFLYHPAFALPSDVADPQFKPLTIRDLSLHKQSPLKPVVFPTSTQTAMVEALAGVYLITAHVGEWSRFHLEYLPQCVQGGVGSQRKVLLSYDELQANLPQQYRNKRLDLEILSNGGEQIRIDDFAKFLQQNNHFKLPLPDGTSLNGFKSSLLGRPEGKELPYAIIKDFLITKVRIHSGLALDGLEFFGIDLNAAPAIPPRNYSLQDKFQKLMSGNNSNGQTQPEKFIARIGNVTNHYKDFSLAPDERIAHFNVRSGAWVDAIQVVLTNGRTSPMYGGGGGGVSQLKAPDGSHIVAFYGYLGQWLNGLGLVYA